MKKYALTGAPGAGKTSVLKVLSERGLAVVEETATDVIRQEQRTGAAEPWKDPGFIDRVVELQRQRGRSATPTPFNSAPCMSRSTKRMASTSFAYSQRRSPSALGIITDLIASLE